MSSAPKDGAVWEQQVVSKCFKSCIRHNSTFPPLLATCLKVGSSIWELRQVLGREELLEGSVERDECVPLGDLLQLLPGDAGAHCPNDDVQLDHLFLQLHQPQVLRVGHPHPHKIDPHERTPLVRGVHLGIPSFLGQQGRQGLIDPHESRVLRQLVELLLGVPGVQEPDHLLQPEHFRLQPGQPQVSGVRHLHAVELHIEAL